MKVSRRHGLELLVGGSAAASLGGWRPARAATVGREFVAGNFSLNLEGAALGFLQSVLSPNRQTELLEINFFNLGIFKLSNDKAEANADSIKRVSAELYCERMELNYKGGTIG